MSESDIELYEISRVNTDDFEALGDYSSVQGTKWDPAWFFSFCSLDEIKRIINPISTEDFLLRKRAEIIADHTRYTRVFANRKKKHKNYSLESNFPKTHYNRVLKALSPEDKNKCSTITYGDIFTNDFNGSAWVGENNSIYASLNYSLHYFINYCNLAFLPFSHPIPMKIRFAAAKIAARVALKTESLDFDMDPRGRFPNSVQNIINSISLYELQYIAGHEISHCLLNHLQSSNLTKSVLFCLNDKSYDYKIFNESQKQEFEADLQSLLRPNYNSSEYLKLYKASLIWFISLDFYEQILSVVSPSDDTIYKTHPTAIERFQNIIDNAKTPVNFDSSLIRRIKENKQLLTEYIIKDVTENYESYEQYGSVYLDEPNTKWRGKKLIDRVDY